MTVLQNTEQQHQTELKQQIEKLNIQRSDMLLDQVTFSNVKQQYDALKQQHESLLSSQQDLKVKLEHLTMLHSTTTKKTDKDKDVVVNPNMVPDDIILPITLQISKVNISLEKLERTLVVVEAEMRETKGELIKLKNQNTSVTKPLAEGTEKSIIQLRAIIEKLESQIQGHNNEYQALKEQNTVLMKTIKELNEKLERVMLQQPLSSSSVATTATMASSSDNNRTMTVILQELSALRAEMHAMRAEHNKSLDRNTEKVLLRLDECCKTKHNTTADETLKPHQGCDHDCQTQKNELKSDIGKKIDDFKLKFLPESNNNQDQDQDQSDQEKVKLLNTFSVLLQRKQHEL